MGSHREPHGAEAVSKTRENIEDRLGGGGGGGGGGGDRDKTPKVRRPRCVAPRHAARTSMKTHTHAHKATTSKRAEQTSASYIRRDGGTVNSTRSTFSFACTTREHHDFLGLRSRSMAYTPHRFPTSNIFRVTASTHLNRHTH